MSDAAARDVDNPLQADAVLRVLNHAEIGNHVLDLAPFVKARPGHQPVGHAVADKSLFQHTRLRVGAVHHREIAQAVLAFRHLLLDFPHHKLGLFLLGVGFHHHRPFPLVVLRPQRLGFPLLIHRNDVGSRFQDVFRRAVILLQQHHLGIGIIMLEAEDVAQVGGAPGINRLVGVAHHADIAVLRPHLFNQFVLHHVGILKFVHHHVDVTFLVAGQDFRIFAEELHHFPQQVVEIQRLAFDQVFFVAFVDAADDFLEVAAAVFGEIRR